MKKFRRILKRVLCLALLFTLLSGTVRVSAAPRWTVPSKAQWSVTRAPYGNDRTPVNISWNGYLAKYYPSAAFCVIPASVKKLNLYVQVYGKDANAGGYTLLNTSQIAKWNVTIDTSGRFPFQSGHTYQFCIRLVKRQDGVYRPVTGYSDVKTVKILYYPYKVYLTQTGARTMRLTWTSVAGAQGYYVYIDIANGRKREKKTITIRGGGNCAYVYTNAVKGTHYCFAVSAYSGSTQSPKKSISMTAS